MSTITNVRNGRNFPDFTSIPDDNEIDLDYYSEINDFHFTPSRHWCLLAEITHVGYDFRLRLAVRDRSDTEFGIHFHLDNDTGLDLSRFKRGHTVAILDPLRHGFLDFSYGIRQEDLSSIRGPDPGTSPAARRGESLPCLWNGRNDSQVH
ncbi:MAG: hypothetical protein M1837_005169 [Sclerophora amabilis]|nr:MAG: hypothetical protein M1837_005169 [Sclerophora amabilis]